MPCLICSYDFYWKLHENERNWTEEGDMHHWSPTPRIHQWKWSSSQITALIRVTAMHDINALMNKWNEWS